MLYSAIPEGDISAFDGAMKPNGITGLQMLRSVVNSAAHGATDMFTGG